MVWDVTYGDYGAIWFGQLILRWCVGELIILEIKTISMRSRQSTCDVEVSGCMVRPILSRYSMAFTCGYKEMTVAIAYKYFNGRYCGHPLLLQMIVFLRPRTLLAEKETVSEMMVCP